MTTEGEPIPLTPSQQAVLDELRKSQERRIGEIAPGGRNSDVLDEGSPVIDVPTIDLPVDKNQKPPVRKRRRGR